MRTSRLTLTRGCAIVAMFVVLGLSVANSDAFATRVVWLQGNAMIHARVKLGAALGAMLLQDTGIEMSMYYKGSFTGTVGPGPAGEIAKVVPEETRWEVNGPCVETDPPKAEIIGLPWLTELMSTSWARISGTQQRRPAYLMECETIVARFVDTCFIDTTRLAVRNTSQHAVAAGFSTREPGEQHCTGTPSSGIGLLTSEGEPLMLFAEHGGSLSLDEE